MDAIDRTILTELQRDAGQTNLALAERVGLSPTPCLRRVRRLEDEGVIKGRRIEIDRALVGLGLTTFVGVKVSRHQDTEAAQFVDTVCSWPEVISCQLISGDVDFLLEVVTTDLDAYQEFLMDRLLKMPSVADVKTSVAIKVFKTGGVLPLE
jgi:Lrp/AsnC family transcriptional regulator, leucine-responsive regulatory protein